MYHKRFSGCRWNQNLTPIQCNHVSVVKSTVTLGKIIYINCFLASGDNLGARKKILMGCRNIEINC